MSGSPRDDHVTRDHTSLGGPDIPGVQWTGRREGQEKNESGSRPLE